MASHAAAITRDFRLQRCKIVLRQPVVFRSELIPFNYLRFEDRPCKREALVKQMLVAVPATVETDETQPFTEVPRRSQTYTLFSTNLDKVQALRMDTGIPAGTFERTRTRTRKNRTRVRVGSRTRTGYPRVLNAPAGPQTRRVYPRNFQLK
ncbi:hypothetical protein B0H19DRAFT_1085585 [Mycena capillaripes]|nr:hypothetical protein B0H19DRAFT_1085585 [Mycena capillaripes]